MLLSTRTLSLQTATPLAESAFQGVYKYAHKKRTNAYLKGKLDFTNGYPSLAHKPSEKILHWSQRAIKKIHSVLTHKTLVHNYSSQTILNSGQFSANPIKMDGDEAGASSSDCVAAFKIAADPMYLGIALQSSKNYLENRVRKHQGTRALIKNMEGARRFKRDPDAASAEDRACYREFMLAAKQIPSLDPNAKHTSKSIRAALVREGPLQLISASLQHTKDLGDILHSIGSSAISSLGATLGLVTLASGVTDMVQASHEHKALQKKKKDAHTQAKNVQTLFDTSASTETHHFLMQQDPTYSNLNAVFQNHFCRIRRQAKRDDRFALGRAMRGVLNGATGIVASSVAIAAAVGTLAVASAFSAGIAFAVISGAIGLAYTIGSAMKYGYRWKAEHTSERRQREAAVLIEAYGSKKLERLFINQPQNEYVALHIIARNFLQFAKGKDSDAQGAMVYDFLKAVFLKAEDINDPALNINDQALKMLLQDVKYLVDQTTSSSQILEFIKKVIAPRFNINYRVKKS